MDKHTQEIAIMASNYLHLHKEVKQDIMNILVLINNTVSLNCYSVAQTLYKLLEGKAEILKHLEMSLDAFEAQLSMLIPDEADMLVELNLN